MLVPKDNKLNNLPVTNNKKARWEMKDGSGAQPTSSYDYDFRQPAQQQLMKTNQASKVHQSHGSNIMNNYLGIDDDTRNNITNDTSKIQRKTF